MRNIRKGAALRVSGAPLTNPHPRDASGADYVRAYFTLRLHRMKFWCNYIFIKFNAKPY